MGGYIIKLATLVAVILIVVLIVLITKRNKSENKEIRMSKPWPKTWDSSTREYEEAEREAKEAKAALAKLERESKICPRCGSTLTLKIQTSGTNRGQKFYGCKDYPKCKYIEGPED